MTQTDMLSPKEFSALLEKRGVKRTARWVRRMVRKGKIQIAPVVGLIPASEVDRLLTATAATA